MNFQVDFGAKDEARLTPCKDDKPKDAEITLFKADSGYFLLASDILNELENIKERIKKVQKETEEIYINSDV